MTVIDVDSHWWEPLTWLEEVDPALQRIISDELPPQSFAEIIFGEVVAELPPEQRDDFLKLLPERIAGAAKGGSAGTLREQETRVQDSPMALIVNQKGSRDAGGRLQWCDAQGVDVQFVNPTVPLGTQQEIRRHRPDLLGRLCEAYNRWSVDRIGDHTDRLIPTAMIDFHDPGKAVAELERMRRCGSRAYLLPMYPIDGRSLAHSDFEPIWATSVDLGMIPVMHVAGGSVVFDAGWCNTGRDDAARTAFMLASSQNAQIAEVPLATLVLNGIFERHPKLVVLCSEFGMSWVPGWLDKLGPTSRDGTPNIGSLVGWHLPRRAQDYVRTNVCFSPLRGNRVDELAAVLGPQSVLFASDYPHPEGSATAVDDFRTALRGRIEPDQQEAFFGGNARALLDGAGLAA